MRKLFLSKSLKHEILIQELQNTCELKKLQKIIVINEKKDDLVSRFFNGKKSEIKEHKIDCFI